MVTVMHFISWLPLRSEPALCSPAHVTHLSRCGCGLAFVCRFRHIKYHKST